MTNLSENYNSTYEALFPVEYYESMAKQIIHKKGPKWFIRPHHIETLTENPKSVRDNIMDSKYESFYA